MFLFGEIVVVVCMILAVVGSVSCLAYLLRLTVRERADLRRRDRERRAARLALAKWSWRDQSRNT